MCNTGKFINFKAFDTLMLEFTGSFSLICMNFCNGGSSKSLIAQGHHSQSVYL